ncbi:MAG: ATPase [Oscillospiraceae bacterium]|nr:ATPase [Oscillospiraceae bacterium]
MAQLVVDDYLDLMDDILEKSKPIFGSKKCMIDADQIRDCIDHIRMNMPDEIKQSKKIVNERKSIIDEANKQAEEIVTRAEARANALVANHEIVKAAEAKAVEIEKQAVMKARTIKTATDEYIVDVLTKTEQTLADNLTAVKRTKGAIKAPRQPQNPNVAPQQNINHNPNQGR